MSCHLSLFIAAVIIGLLIFLNTNQKSNDSRNIVSRLNDTPISDVPKDDFSCQPNECQNKINIGINGIPYPNCNPKVQINNTGASVSSACDYWKNQQKYFGVEDYVNLSDLSKERKHLNGEQIGDGFLGMNDYIEIHRNAAGVFLKAEEEFNKKYGLSRVGSTYFLPSYPNGYTFIFSGSLNKRAVRGKEATPNDLFYEGEYIIPSNHFWGVAIELNSETNWGNRIIAQGCEIDIPPELVGVFESNGLRWGGRFFSDDKKYFDPMHFEVVPDCVEEGVLEGFGGF